MLMWGYTGTGLAHNSHSTVLEACICIENFGTLTFVSMCASQLFASSKLESEEFAEMEDLANHMGLFLQKTNIIRDYLEDINEEPAPRCALSSCA